MVRENDIVFREVQRFGVGFRWLFVLLMLAMVGAVFSGTVNIIQGSFDALRLIISIALGVVLPLGIAALFFTAKLETEVRSDGLHVRYFPFHLDFRRFETKDIGECYARTYKPLLEYGGWGIRCGFKGRAYNVSGNQGVQLVFNDGKRLLIGSQKPDELEAAIRSIA